ncbi:MAG: hypothetical protein ABIG69_16080 [Bacteroidota bacterium]
MKKEICVLIIASGLFGLSCSDDLNPTGDFKEKYILNLVMRGDTTLQYATLSSNYSVGGFDPYENTTDPAVSGADIRVWQGDSVYVFEETTVPRSADSRYSGDKIAYKNNSFALERYGRPIEVEVVLPHGKKLKGYSKTPEPIEFDLQNTLSVPSEKDFFYFKWNTYEGQVYFEPRFIFNYVVSDGMNKESKTKIVPSRYHEVDGNIEPYFPKPSNNPLFSLSKAALDSAMIDISRGNSQKQNYTIYNAYMEVLVYDKSLTSYYVSTNQALDGFSVKVDATDYTNIEGGLGVFASYRKQSLKVKLLRNYIESFGYKAGVPD